MITLTYTLVWSDGGTAKAAITARDALDSAAVIYQGSVARLGAAILARSEPATLERVLRDVAERTGATLSIERTGNWPAEDDVQP